jgi:hypothetical protein
MAEFDPNDPRTGKNYMWATFKPGRRGAAGFKMHMGRGPALNACASEHDYILYEWDREVSRWKEVTRMEKRHTQTVCFNCKRDVANPKNKGTHYYRPRLSWMFVGLPTLREIGLCPQCRTANGGRFAQMNRAPIDKRFFA